jgi:hemin uptake protein HemP
MSRTPLLPTPDPDPAAPRVVDSRELLAGRKEILILHGAEAYRLRLTGQNKLILTK